MTERTIKLTGDLEAFVDAQIESGAYATPEDVVRAGFEALKGGPIDGPYWAADNTDGVPLTVEELGKMVAEGDADFAAGCVYRYDKPGDLARDIKREGRRLWRERQAKKAEPKASTLAKKRGETSRKSTTGSGRTKT